MDVDEQVELVLSGFEKMATSRPKDETLSVLDAWVQLMIANGYNADILQDVKHLIRDYIDCVIEESVLKTSET